MGLFGLRVKPFGLRTILSKIREALFTLRLELFALREGLLVLRERFSRVAIRILSARRDSVMLSKGFLWRENAKGSKTRTSTVLRRQTKLLLSAETVPPVKSHDSRSFPLP